MAFPIHVHNYSALVLKHFLYDYWRGVKPRIKLNNLYIIIIIPLLDRTLNSSQGPGGHVVTLIPQIETEKGD